MVLTLGDLKFLKELKAAGDLGGIELNIRVILDRLVRASHVAVTPNRCARFFGARDFLCWASKERN